MTQPAIVPVQAPQDVDILQKILADLTSDRKRLLNSPPTDVAGVVKEIRDTFMEYVTDLALEMQKQRDWTLGAIEEIDQELDDVKSGNGTQLMPEHAEKFKALAQGVDFLITQLTGVATNLPPAVVTELTNLKKLAADCLELIEEHTLEVEDEPEDGPEVEDEPEGGDETGA